MSVHHLPRLTVHIWRILPHKLVVRTNLLLAFETDLVVLLLRNLYDLTVWLNLCLDWEINVPLTWSEGGEHRLLLSWYEVLGYGLGILWRPWRHFETTSFLMERWSLREDWLLRGEEGVSRNREVAWPDIWRSNAADWYQVRRVHAFFNLVEHSLTFIVIIVGQVRQEVLSHGRRRLVAIFTLRCPNVPSHCQVVFATGLNLLRVMVNHVLRGFNENLVNLAQRHWLYAPFYLEALGVGFRRRSIRL